MKNLVIIFFLTVLSSCDTEKVEIYYENGQIKTSGQTSSGMKVGLWTDYYEDGLVKSKINYNGLGNADGECFAYHVNGELKMKSHYVNGKLEGKMEFWYSTGKLKTEGSMKNDMKHGLWLRYDSLSKMPIRNLTP